MSYLDEMAEQGYDADHIDDFHEFMLPLLLEANGIDRQATVLDIGAGQGHCLIPLHNKGWAKLVALDRDPRNFTLFEEKYGIRSLCCNIASEAIALPDRSVGAVLCFHLIEHLPAPDNLLSECTRVLGAGGTLFIVTPDWRKQYRTFWRDPTHLRPYDKESIVRLLRIFGLQAQVSSWGSAYGLGRMRAYHWLPRLGMIGADLLATGVKPSRQQS